LTRTPSSTLQHDKQTQDLLSAHTLSELFHATALPTVLLKDGKFIAANTACASLLGLSSAEDLVGLTPLDFSPALQPNGEHTQQRINETLGAAVAGGANEFDWEAMHRDGTKLYIRINLTALHIEDDLIIHAVLQDVTRERAQRDQLSYIAYHDSVTELPNRHQCLTDLGPLLRQEGRKDVCIIKVGIDQFSYFNNVFGTAFGDELLCKVRDALLKVLRDGDRLYRISGGRFAILLEGITNRNQAIYNCERVLQLFESPVGIDGFKGRILISLGCSLVDGYDIDAETLLQESQIALSEAKSTRQGSYMLFEAEMRQKRDRFLTIREELRRALRNNELELYYQPQVDLRSKRIVGAESLIRWNHPIRGVLPPAEFITIAEDSGLIVEMTRWILQQVCHQGALWKAAGWSDFTLAVNLAAKHFEYGLVQQDVQLALESTGLAAEHLELEMTESALFEHTDVLVSLLDKWRTQGIKLAIDDFGTGYSNLAYLSQLPISKLKIDQSFIRDYVHNKNHRIIVQTIILMAKSLKITTLAEGVEEESTRTLLYAMGCDAIQGYLISRPVPVKEFETLIADQFV